MIYVINMALLKLDRDGIDEAVDKAIAVLQSGGVIAYPTETFYGLGVRFDKHGSLKRLYDLKKRPQEKAMPLIIGDIGLLGMLVSPQWLGKIPASARLLMGKYWPGPLTLLMPAIEGLSEYVSAHTGKVAVRVPGRSFALDLARKARFAITATSANPSGMPPADDGDGVSAYFDGNLDLIVDGGKTPGGLPSTIVDVSGGSAEIVREGVVSRDAIEKFLAQSR